MSNNNHNLQTGEEWARLDELEAGDVIRLDSGFTCVHLDTTRVVQKDEHGLFFSCDEGHHYLDGQLPFDSLTDQHLVGVTIVASSSVGAKSRSTHSPVETTL